jgi:hypothetical protein
VLHADLGGIFDLAFAAAHGGNQTAGRHGTGYTHFTLTTHLGAGDGSVLLVQDTDSRGREQISKDALLVGVIHKPQVIMPHRWDNAGSAVGGRSYNPATGGIFLVHRQGP